MAKKAVVEVDEPKVQTTFSKEQIVGSKRFNNNKDLVNALLDQGKTYTISQVEEMIEKYQKGKVK